MHDRIAIGSRFRMLACDYDRTLADEGVVGSSTQDWLVRLKRAGWILGLVTGRELDDLKRIFPGLDLFDIAVAENGALLYLPARQEIEYLGSTPPESLTRELTRRGIQFSAGRIIVSVDSRWIDDLRALISEMGVESEVILNRDSAMILPTGIDKASGVKSAANRLQIDLSQVVAVGDAENDLNFLRACGLAVAVANAIEPVKAIADLVLARPSGEGIVELVSEYLLTAGKQELE